MVRLFIFLQVFLKDVRPFLIIPNNHFLRVFIVFTCLWPAKAWNVFLKDEKCLFIQFSEGKCQINAKSISLSLAASLSIQTLYRYTKSVHNICTYLKQYQVAWNEMNERICSYILKQQTHLASVATCDNFWAFLSFSSILLNWSKKDKIECGACVYLFKKSRMSASTSFSDLTAS